MTRSQRRADLRPDPRSAALPVTVEELGPGMEGGWDELVRASPGASAFHAMGWRRAVETTLGHRPCYLIARRGGLAVGLLPLFETRGLLGGRCLISLPFAVRGGVLADEPEARRALVAAARHRAERRRVLYLELRGERAADPELITKNLYVTFRTDLTADEEPLLRAMDRKRRQMLTYAERAGYRAEVAGVEALDTFYSLFAQSMRRHGTPVYPRSFLRQILVCLPGDSNLFLVRDRDGTPLAGVLNLLFGGVLMPFYSGARAGADRRGVDDFLYGSLLRWGREHGFHTFDFGRSRRGTGAYDYKRRWGMDEVRLDYQYHLVRARRLPDQSPGNPRYRLAIELWRRLPLPLTRWLGPPIARRIP